MSSGFKRLLSVADDLVLDIPDAMHLLSLFLGRAIVDEVLPPAFLAAALPSLPDGGLGVAVVQATGGWVGWGGWETGAGRPQVGGGGLGGEWRTGGGSGAGRRWVREGRVGRWTNWGCPVVQATCGWCEGGNMGGRWRTGGGSGAGHRWV